MKKFLVSNGQTGRRREAAFTFKDLLAVVGVLGLLGMLAIPVLANSKSGSKRAVCANNLSHIGRAFALWGNDHGENLPSQLIEAFGGTRNHSSGLQNNTWFQFAFVSNELVTPKVLACPSDPAVKVAGDFTRSSDDGFLQSNYRNNAVSYILGFPYKEEGRLVLSADRKMRFAQLSTGSPSGFSPVAYADPDLPGFGWLPGIHEYGGNLLFNDGSVEQTDDARLKVAMAAYNWQAAASSGSRSRPFFHYPRPPLP